MCEYCGRNEADEKVIIYLLEELKELKKVNIEQGKRILDDMQIIKQLQSQNQLMVNRVRELQGKEVDETVDNRERDL